MSNAAETPAPPSRLALGAAFGAVYLFWGATFLAIRYAVADVPPLLTIAIRCAGGAAILYAWVHWREGRRPASFAHWRVAALAGALLFVGCHGLLAWAEQRVSSGQAALVMTAIPLWIVVLSAAIARRRPSTPVLAGLAFGIAGVAVLTGGGMWTGRPVDVAMLVFGTFTWAAGSLVGKHGAHPESVAHMTAMQLTAGAVWLLVASIATGELATWSPAQLSARAVLALAFLIVCGTVLGFGAYNWLLRATSPAAASSYAFVNPIVALLLGALAGDGVVTGRTVVAAVLVLVALALTHVRPPRRAATWTEALEHAPQR